jgi:hypothetical protein
VRQADRAGREFLTRLTRQAPLLPGADVLAFVDIDSTQKRVYGHKKQGARFAHTKIQGRSLLVRGLNALAAAGQGELFPAWRYHAVFTGSPCELLQAEEHHRGHAVTGQVFADLNDGPLAHLPPGHFNANAAWLVIAATAFNLVRAAGALASRALAKARAATVRTALIAVAARAARHGRGHVTLHLPSGRHREREWPNLFEAACGPPAAAA